MEVEINFTLGQIIAKRFQICSTIGEAHQKAAVLAIKEAAGLISRIQEGVEEKHGFGRNPRIEFAAGVRNSIKY
jgi:hypothetical protein